MKSRILTTRRARFALIILALAAPVLARAQDEGENVEKYARMYDAQWTGVTSMRLEYSQRARTRTANEDYDGCSWEIAGNRARIVESRSLASPAAAGAAGERAARDQSGSIRVRSECYYDGEKTWELTEPLDLYPIEDVSLEDYFALRAKGVRANISNRYKHWRFWSLCPLPRYFSVPNETELLSMTELVKKYESRLVNRKKNERGEEIIQIEVRNPEISGEGPLRSWSLFLSLNMNKSAALAGYQMAVTAEREDGSEAKFITEYVVGNFRATPNGLWYPVTVEMRVIRGNAGSSLIKTTIRSVSVNTDSGEMHRMKFPQNMVVTEDVWSDDDEKPERRWHIWGKDGPAKSFHDEEQFNEYYVEQYGDLPSFDVKEPLGREARLLIYAGVAFCAVVAVFGIYVFFGRKEDEEKAPLKPRDRYGDKA